VRRHGARRRCADARGSLRQRGRTRARRCERGRDDGCGGGPIIEKVQAIDQRATRMLRRRSPLDYEIKRALLHQPLHIGIAELAAHLDRVPRLFVRPRPVRMVNKVARAARWIVLTRCRAQDLARNLDCARVGWCVLAFGIRSITTGDALIAISDRTPKANVHTIAERPDDRAIRLRFEWFGKHLRFVRRNHGSDAHIVFGKARRGSGSREEGDRARKLTPGQEDENQKRQNNNPALQRMGG